MVYLKIILLALLTCFTILKASASPINIGFSGVEPDNRSFRVAQRVVAEVGRRMQREITLLSLPAKRATAMLRRGEIHAEVSRVADYKRRVKNAIQLKPIISTLPLYVYSNKHQFTVDGWQSLAPYTALTIRGWVFVNQNLAKHNVRTIEADSPKQALHLLQASRADILILSRIDAEGALKALHYNHPQLKRLSAPVALQNSYTFFSGHYPAIAAVYEKHLLDIINEGLLAAIVSNTQ